MKKILMLFLCFSTLTFGLSGSLQARMEKVYDSYRAQFIEGRTSEEQGSKMQSIQKALWAYQNKAGTSETDKMKFAYLSHLFCEAESIIDGRVCQDNYTISETLTAHKNTLDLSEIRRWLIEEHSKRRVNRGLSMLTESQTLNTIAQKYALSLCKAGYISHDLNGSTLEKRYQDGKYSYKIGGENLGSGQTNIAQLLDQLITSIHHRNNMFEPNFREIGVGQCDNVWVLNYGAPL